MKKGDCIMKKRKKINKNSHQYQNNIDNLIRDALTPNEKPSKELEVDIIKKALAQKCFRS